MKLGMKNRMLASKASEVTAGAKSISTKVLQPS